MFTPDERARLRAALLAEAGRDVRISGAAVTGSAAAEREDPWSDVDLAFGVADGADLAKVLADWTGRMYDRYRAVHHVDVRAGVWIYRVFLLPSTLQVDLAFVPAAEFGALSPAFRLISGTANEPRQLPTPAAADLIGLGWLYALHARSSIVRRKLWQAEYMISGVRDHALALACIRHGLPATHGRGMDQLPGEVAARFEGALVRQLDPGEQWRAFREAVAGLLGEVRCIDEDLSRRLQDVLMLLSDSCGQAP